MTVTAIAAQRPRIRAVVLRWLVAALAGVGGCAQAQPFFVGETLPGGTTADAAGVPVPVQVPVLRRAARALPLRYRVIVVPGSGCAGLGPVADRMFAGLLHAEMLVLHKPGVDLQARTAAADCSAAFVAADALSAWRDHAIAALRADAQQRRVAGAPVVPQWLVGFSEGVELLPALAADVPQLAGLVAIGHPGLDPVEAGALQAERIGHSAAWNALAADVAQGALPGSALRHGRTLRYWRDLWSWRLAARLHDAPWPLLQAWGTDDALMPSMAFERFAVVARHRQAGYCAVRLEGADHGLQTPTRDGVQFVWAQLEAVARGGGLCIGPRNTVYILPLNGL